MTVFTEQIRQFLHPPIIRGGWGESTLTNMTSQPYVFADYQAPRAREKPARKPGKDDTWT